MTLVQVDPMRRIHWPQIGDWVVSLRHADPIIGQFAGINRRGQGIVVRGYNQLPILLKRHSILRLAPRHAMDEGDAEQLASWISYEEHWMKREAMYAQKTGRRNSIPSRTLLRRNAAQKAMSEFVPMVGGVA